MTANQADPPAKFDSGHSPAIQAALAIFAAWIMVLGVDIFLHAGLLATLYVDSHPFVLDAYTAFYRIPLGYLSFLIFIAALYWLFQKLKVVGTASGVQHGLLAGLIVWGGFLLGLFSISTVPWPLLIGWWLGQSLEWGLAGALFGAVANGVRFRHVWSLVALIVIACFLSTVVLQSLGWAPPMQTLDGPTSSLADLFWLSSQH